MSMMYCHEHDRHWDSDFLEQCPSCEHETPSNPVKAYAYELAVKGWHDAMLAENQWKEALHLNNLSNNFAYTDGSYESYRRAVIKARKHREACFEAMMYLT